MSTYRDSKKFNTNAFRTETQIRRSSEADLGFFKDPIFHNFNKHATCQKKVTSRKNEAPFMTKELNVAIMKRSRLRSKFLREKN